MKRRIPRLVGLLCATLFPCAALALDFVGGGTGAIPDNNPAGINVTFGVAGFSQPVRNVRLTLNLTHTFVGDLRATLISPGGVARLLVFGRVGYRSAASAGTTSDLGGVYVFDDGGQDFWTAAASATPVPPGRYRSSTTSRPTSTSGSSNHGGCVTSFAGVFGGLVASDVNGTWTLNIADEAGADLGSVNSAVLSLSTTLDDIFANGFEAPVHGSCVAPWLDLTGSGRTSYVLVRNTGGGPSGDETWFVKDNPSNGSDGVVTSFVHGIASDFFLTGDWDGDGIGDAAVWRPGTLGQFIVRPSSRPSRPLMVTFGVSGDDPKHVGDYDGDGISDFALYRGGAIAGALSHTLIHLSGGGPDRDFLTGENGSFPAGGVDYSGDGIADMAIQKNAGGGAANFRLYSGLDGTQITTFNFGTPTDVIVVGNHSGTPVSDITVVRGSAGTILWTTRDTGTATELPAVTFGASATDFPLSGDYDGDGLDDYAIWRPSAVVGETKFSIRPSTSPASPFDVVFGQNGDYPPGNARDH